MLVPVFEGKVLFLADLGELGSEIVRASGIDQLVGSLLEVVEVPVLVSNQVQEDLSLFLVQVGEVRHELLEVLLVIQVPLVLSFSGQVQHFDVVLEIFRVGVHVLEDLSVDEFFVVELSDLFFWVEFNSSIGAPLFAEHLSEKIPLLLSLLWLWELLSLNQVEWESQEFLPIRWVQLFAFSAEILNSRLVSFKTVISLLNSLLEGTWSLWPWGIMSLVNESLDFHWITLGSFQLINVAKSDVFETVDLTKRPKDVVFIFSHSLDLEVFGEVRIDGLSFGKTIKHLSLGKWTRGVNVKVFFNITLGIG